MNWCVLELIQIKLSKSKQLIVKIKFIKFLMLIITIVIYVIYVKVNRFKNDRSVTVSMYK